MANLVIPKFKGHPEINSTGGWLSTDVVEFRPTDAQCYFDIYFGHNCSPPLAAPLTT